MAILWGKKIAGVYYQVRTAGKTRRLYTNGVFHSQYNAANPVGGSVWDLLMLPAFFFPPNSLHHILVLGVGGGAVIKQLDHFLHPKSLLGIELSSVHLSIAKRFFGVVGKNIELVQADAKQWVKKYRGKKFDLVIDDLFGEENQEPIRAVEADAAWVKSLTTLLSNSGALVMNFDSAKALRKSAFFHSAPIRKNFASAFRLATAQYENNIGAFFRTEMQRRDLFNHLAQIPDLNPARKTCRLKFQLRKITL